jgi:hypothetical protein
VLAVRQNSEICISDHDSANRILNPDSRKTTLIEAFAVIKTSFCAGNSELWNAMAAVGHPQVSTPISSKGKENPPKDSTTKVVKASSPFVTPTSRQVQIVVPLSNCRRNPFSIHVLGCGAIPSMSTMQFSPLQCFEDLYWFNQIGSTQVVAV